MFGPEGSIVQKEIISVKNNKKLSEILHREELFEISFA
jgi:hypothetical protein